MSETYSVYTQRLAHDGGYAAPKQREVDRVDPVTALRVASHCAHHLDIGRVTIVSNRDDSIGIDWRRGEGVVFPKRHQMRLQVWAMFPQPGASQS